MWGAVPRYTGLAQVHPRVAMARVDAMRRRTVGGESQAGDVTEMALTLYNTRLS